jgi:hypothetical protein
MNKLLMMDGGTVGNMQSSCQNKFVKSVHLVCFIIKKFVTMHGHTDIKKTYNLYVTYDAQVPLVMWSKYSTLIPE